MTNNGLEIYSELKQNSFRLISILIEDGTKIVNAQLNAHIIRDYTTVQNFFSQKRNEINSCHHLNHKQKSKIFPRGPSRSPTSSVMNFDLSLSIAMFQNFISLNPNFDNCLESGSSIASHLKRMRDIRNDLYGHLHTLGLANKELIRLEDTMKSNLQYGDYSAMAKLEMSIYGLCLDKNEKNKYKTVVSNKLNDSLEPNKIESLKAKFENSIINDRQTVLEIMKNISEKIITQNNSSRSDLDDIKNKLDHFQTAFNDNKDNAASLLNKIFGTIQNKNLIPNINSIMDSNEEIKNKLDKIDNEFLKIKENYNKIVQNHIESSSKLNNIQSSSKNVNKNISVLVNASNEINKNQLMNEERLKNIENNLNNRFKLIELHDLKELILDEKKLYYKILILSAENLNDDKLNKRELSDIIGSIEWDLIVDLDYEAREPGIGLADLICKNLEFNKNYTAKNYSNIQTITENEKNLIKNGECCLYYLANGCKNIGVDRPAKFVTSAMKLRTFLISFILEIKNKDIICFSLIMNGLKHAAYDDSLQNIGTLNKYVYDAIVESEAHNDLMYLGMAPMDFNENKSKLNKIFPDEDSKNLITFAPSHQLMSCFSSFKSNKNMDDLEIPGSQSTWRFQRSKYSVFSSSFEIYHINIGKYDNLKESDLREQQIEFLKGNEITPTQIYINDVLNKKLLKYPTFVERDLIEEIETEIKNHIKSKTNFFSLRIIKILHESSAGGTTLGRILLYRLHKEIPCIRIKSLEEENKLFSLCTHLSEVSQLPLVFLIDEGDFSRENIFERKLMDLSKSLSESKIIRSLFIYVKHTPFISPDLYQTFVLTNNEKKQTQAFIKTFHLKANLSETEVVGFKNMHKHLGFLENDSSLEESKLIYWFGLTTFGGEYKHAPTLVNYYLKLLLEINDWERIFNIMYFICFFYFNTGERFPFDLVSLYLQVTVGKLNKSFKCEDDKKYLPLYKLFILREDHNKLEIRPLHKVIAELILQKSPKNLETIRNRKQQLELFYKIYLELLSLNPIDFQNDLKQITAFLFIIGRDERIDKHYTVFLVETKHLFGIEWTKNMLKEMYDKLKNFENLGPSIGSLLARFVFYVEKNKQEGISLMRNFLGIKKILERRQKINENWNQSQFLTVYGGFLRFSLDSDHSIEKNLEIAGEAVIAYNMAQKLPYKDILSKRERDYKSGLMNRYSYIGECKLRMKLLEIIYYKCSKKKSLKKEYNDTILSHDSPLIRESENEIMKILDKIEMFQESKIFSIDDIDEFDVHKIKLKLIEMRLDVSNKPSIQKILLDYPESVQLHVYDTVRLIEEQRLNENNEEVSGIRTWEDLAQRKEIIESIIRRCKLQIEKANYPHYVNYRDLINAFINCQVHNDLRNQNTLDLAIVYASKWAKDFSEEPDPYFYLGIFNMIDGIDKNDSEKLKTAMKHFATCKEKYILHERLKGYRKLAFLYGNSTGLSSLIPFSDNCETNRLKEFSGRLQNDTIPHIKINNIISAFYSKRNDDSEALNDEAQREKLYTFYVVFARDKIQMWKPRPIEIN